MEWTASVDRAKRNDPGYNAFAVMDEATNATLNESDDEVRKRHLYWRCSLLGPNSAFPTEVDALLDSGLKIAYYSTEPFKLSIRTRAETLDRSHLKWV